MADSASHPCHVPERFSSRTLSMAIECQSAGGRWVPAGVMDWHDGFSAADDEQIRSDDLTLGQVKGDPDSFAPLFS